jgi:acyl carrier protein
LIEGEAGLGIMGYTLQQKLSPQTLVAPLILGNQAPFEMASGELQPIYKELFAKAKADAQEDAGHAKSNLRNTLFNLPEGERHEVLAAAIKRQVALVIRHEDPDAIDPDVDLFSLGVDSLMAAEMVSRLSRMIKEPVAPTIIFDQRTVNDLTGFLLEVTIDFSAEEAGNVNVEPDEESTPEESVSERSPVEQSNANGSTQDPDWEEALKKILSDELKRRGKDVAALEESRSLRRQLSRLASVLKKRT